VDDAVRQLQASGSRETVTMIAGERERGHRR
jgi:hypothetical protein